MSETGEGPIYVTRGMKAQCSCGTAPKGQYLNIVVDHGVVAGAEQQPVLNTNDHTPDTVIGFGNCTSDSNPKLQVQKGILNGLIGASPLNLIVKCVSGKGIVDHLTDIGIVSCKCEPDTPQVWQMGDEEHILDGAPILTKDSVLYCRNGGIITIMEEQGDAEAITTGEEDQAEGNQEVDVVASEAQAAAEAEKKKIKAVTPPDMQQDSTSESNQALTSDGASGMASYGGGGNGSVGVTGANAAASITEMAAMAIMATYPSSISSHVMPSLGIAGLSADNCTPVHSSLAQRTAALTQNQNIKMPASALNEQGLIMDLSKLNEFQMFQQPVSVAGDSAAAAYNAMKQLTPQSAPSFSQVIFEMEAYGAVETPNGMFVPGLSDYLAKQGCGVEFFLPEEELPTGQGAAIGLSLNQGAMSYQTLMPDQKADCFSLMITPKN